MGQTGGFTPPAIRKPPFHADNEPDASDRSLEACRYWLLEHIQRVLSTELPAYKDRLLAFRLSEDPLATHVVRQFFLEVQLKRRFWRKPVWVQNNATIVSSWVASWWPRPLVVEEVPKMFAVAVEEWRGSLNQGKPRVVSYVNVAEEKAKATSGSLSLVEDEPASLPPDRPQPPLPPLPEPTRRTR